MKLSKIHLIIIGGAILVILVLVLILGAKPKPEKNPYNITASLKFWTYDSSKELYKEAIKTFTTLYPNVSFEQRNFTDPNEYEQAVIAALASGQGPDIFMVKNTTLPKTASLIFPIPAQGLSLASLRQFFPQIVEKNFYLNGQTYGLPLSIDTLALIYNRDIFNQNAIVSPPKNWEEFLKLIPILKKTDANGKIIQAAAAIGGSQKSINEASDLLTALMLQTGTQMVDPSFSSATFASDEGLNALNFYLQFAQLNNPNYTWDDYFSNNSLNAFSQGKVAIIFDYASSLSYLKTQNPFLNIGIGPLPQPTQAKKNITLARYWAYTVSRQTHYPQLAWKFILTLTTNPDIAKKYLEQSQKPPALNSLINQYLNDPLLSTFSQQVLFASSWPQKDDKQTREIFSQMIEMVNSGRLEPKEALTQAQDQITRLMAQTSF